ncbi:hypothetical protein D3C86_1894470 [compost metagenome]
MGGGGRALCRTGSGMAPATRGVSAMWAGDTGNCGVAQPVIRTQATDINGAASCFICRTPQASEIL